MKKFPCLKLNLNPTKEGKLWESLNEDIEVYPIPIFVGKNKIVGFVLHDENRRSLYEIYKDWKYWEIENVS